MDIHSLFPTYVQQTLATGVVLLGLMTLWRGLHGGSDGRQSLVRRHIDMLDRLEGWRFTVVGLTLIGVGVAWLIDSRGLLVLSLGIGFVELHEATHVMRAWRWSGNLSQQPPSTTRPSGVSGSRSPATELRR